MPTLTKLMLIPYEDAAFKKARTDEAFSVQVNPETFTTNQTVAVSRKQPLGSSGTNLRYLNTPSERLEFEFLIDGTGAVPAPASGGLLGALAAGFQLLGTEKKSDVMERIEKLRNTVFSYHGPIHQPRFVQLVWGTLLFQGRLTSMNTRYTLFQPDGTPLRAFVKCGFEGSVSDQNRVQREGAESPDLTHERSVQQGDTLALLAFRQYNDPALALELARVNDLDTLRRLNPGQKLRLPPVEK